MTADRSLPALVPVILSGGSGTRLWPVSRRAHPKPFMRLLDGETMAEKTLRRALELLERLDLEELDRELRAQVKTETSIQRKNSLLKRLKVFFCASVRGRARPARRCRGERRCRECRPARRPVRRV